MKIPKEFKTREEVQDEESKVLFLESEKVKFIVLRRYNSIAEYKNITGGGNPRQGPDKSSEDIQKVKVNNSDLIIQSKKIYRDKFNDKKNVFSYYSDTDYDESIVSPNMEIFLGSNKDYDGITFQIEFQKGLSDKEKQDYLKITDEIVASIE